MSEHLIPWLVPFRPSRAAARLRRSPRWLIGFCVLAVLAGAIEVFSHSPAVEATLEHLPNSATAPEREAVREDLDAALPARVAMIPVQVFVSTSLRALMWYLLFAAFGAGDLPRGKQLMSISVGAGVIDQCERLAETLHAFYGTSLATETSVFPWSVLALTGEMPSYAGTLLLTSLNMFTLWSVGAVGWALSVLCSTSKIKAVLIAAAVWTVSAGCTIVLLHLLRNAYALSP
ncbi:MAG: hypothetical protein IT282_16925 [Bacteroidetes bacterium]|nr:hypothetical protein [Bacteroidota bacterium]